MALAAMTTLMSLWLWEGQKASVPLKKTLSKALGTSPAMVLHGGWGHVIFRRRNGEKGSWPG